MITAHRIIQFQHSTFFLFVFLLTTLWFPAGSSAYKSSVSHSSDVANGKLALASGYKFPWPAERSWLLTTGRTPMWHSESANTAAVDFFFTGANPADRRVLTSIGGTVTRICTGPTTVDVYIKDSNGYTLGYAHLDKMSLSSGVLLNHELPQGQVLGTPKIDSFNEQVTCTDKTRYLVGANQIRGTGHLHWILPRAALNVDGWTVQYPIDGWKKDGILSGPGKRFTSSNTPLNVANKPPSVPALVAPLPSTTLTSRAVNMVWRDTGDVDNGPRQTRNFYAEVHRVVEGGTEPVATLQWQFTQEWNIIVHQEGLYYWQVRSGDGGGKYQGASAYSAKSYFFVRTPTCSLKAEGDADCDNSVTLFDFELFRGEFISKQPNQADFNGDRVVDLEDFELFRQGYIKYRNSLAAVTTTQAEVESTRPIIAFLDETLYSRTRSRFVEADIFFEGDSTTIASGVDVTLAYTPNVLDYQEMPASYASERCASANQGNGYIFQSRLAVEHDPSGGLIRIARTSGVGDVSAQASLFCAGTVVFRIREDSPLPATGRVTLVDESALWDVVGPHAFGRPQFDEARREAVVLVDIVARPTNLNLADFESPKRDGIELNWRDHANDELGFRVYRRAEGEGEWLQVGSVEPDITTFIDRTALPSRIYHYYVTVFSKIGESGGTEILTFTPLAETSLKVFLPVLTK